MSQDSISSSEIPIEPSSTDDSQTTDDEGITRTSNPRPLQRRRTDESLSGISDGESLDTLGSLPSFDHNNTRISEDESEGSLYSQQENTPLDMGINSLDATPKKEGEGGETPPPQFLPSMNFDPELAEQQLLQAAKSKQPGSDDDKVKKHLKERFEEQFNLYKKGEWEEKRKKQEAELLDYNSVKYPDYDKDYDNGLLEGQMEEWVEEQKRKEEEIHKIMELLSNEEPPLHVYDLLSGKKSGDGSDDEYVYYKIDGDPFTFAPTKKFEDYQAEELRKQLEEADEYEKYKFKACYICGQVNEEEPFDLIELYDELTIEGLANDPVLKKAHHYCLGLLPAERGAASLKGKGKHDLEYQTNVKRVPGKAWGEMSPATRHQEYLEKYYKGQFSITGITKSKNEIWKVERDEAMNKLQELNVDVDNILKNPQQQTQELKDQFKKHKKEKFESYTDVLDGELTEQNNEGFGNFGCYLCGLPLILNIHRSDRLKGLGTKKEEIDKDDGMEHLSRLRFLAKKGENDDKELKIEPEHIAHVKEHNLFFGGQLTEDNYVRIEQRVLEKTEYLRTSSRKVRTDIITEICNTIDKKLMTDSYTKAINGSIPYIDDIIEILKENGITADMFSDFDNTVNHLLILVLYTVLYKWSHASCNKIKLHLSFFTHSEETDTNGENYAKLQPNDNIIAHTLQQIVKGLDSKYTGSFTDQGQWVKGEGGVMRWESLREAYPDEQEVDFTDSKTGKTFVINDEFGKYSLHEQRSELRKEGIAFHLNTFEDSKDQEKDSIVYDFMYRRFVSVKRRIRKICDIYNGTGRVNQQGKIWNIFKNIRKTVTHSGYQGDNVLMYKGKEFYGPVLSRSGKAEPGKVGGGRKKTRKKKKAICKPCKKKKKTRKRLYFKDLLENVQSGGLIPRRIYFNDLL